MKTSLKITHCKVLQMFTDLIFLVFGVGAFTVVFMIKSDNLPEARLILGQACLESDSSGTVFVILIWGAVLATLVTFNAVLGILSLLRKKWGLLYCYSMLGYAMVLQELLFFITLNTHLVRMIQNTGVCLQDVLVQYYTGPFNSSIKSYSGAWDYLHRIQHCCGVHGGKVFNSMVNWNRTWLEKYYDPFFNTTAKLEEFRVVTILPYTCCKFKGEEQHGHGHYNSSHTIEDVVNLLVDEDCPSKPTNSNSFISVSCLQSVSQYVNHLSDVLFDVSLGMECLQFLACLAALYTSRATKNLKLRAHMLRKGLIKK